LENVFEQRKLERERKRKEKKEEFKTLPEGQQAIIKSSSKASKNARKRDIENSKVLTDEEMEQANALQSKAQEAKMKLVPERKIKNNFKFAQFIQRNWKVLRMGKYLTMAEKNFLVDIMPNIGFDSNCIVDDVMKTSNAVPLTQQDIANMLGTNKSKVSKLVSSLIDKGIMARSETGIEDNNARAYALFVNPNVIISGNKDSVNLTLQAMFKKVPKELRDLPDQLF
jgi:predicted transcriptional regulator